MSPNLAVRITAPFSDLSGMVRNWALKADKVLVYQHDDDKVHIHVLMLGVSCDKERLKQIAKESRIVGGGNEFWSFKTKVKGGIAVSPENSDRFITYMSKGKYDPSYNKGWDVEELARLKAAWVQRSVCAQERLYLEFIDYLLSNKEDDGTFHFGTPIIYDTVENVKVLQSWARSWAFSHHKSFWTVRTATDAKMVFLTYCMRFSITIPQDIKLW